MIFILNRTVLLSMISRTRETT